jgi:hypothetical protein
MEHGEVEGGLEARKGGEIAAGGQSSPRLELGGGGGFDFRRGGWLSDDRSG